MKRTGTSGIPDPSDPDRRNHSSRQPGGASVVVGAGEVRVVQRKLVGLILAAFGVAMPALVLVSEQRFRRDPWAYLSGAFDGFGSGMTVMAAAGALLCLLLTVYGAFWLFWTRHLVVNLHTHRLRFRTGFWPWIKTIETSTREVEAIHLSRIVRNPMRPTGGRAPNWESWEVRLHIPGSAEPLFLGEWGLRREALEEIEQWKKIFPRLTLDERDLRPDVPRADE